jgi:hypothetical protein
VNRQPRDHDANDHGAPLAPAGADASLHPRVRPVLRGHVARRHLRPAADLPPHPAD